MLLIWLVGFIPTSSSSLSSSFRDATAAGLPRWHSVKESTCQRRRRKRHGSGRCPGGGNGYPLQYSCLENPMDRGVWWATVHGITKSQTCLSNYACTHTIAAS